MFCAITRAETPLTILRMLQTASCAEYVLCSMPRKVWPSHSRSGRPDRTQEERQAVVSSHNLAGPNFRISTIKRRPSLFTLPTLEAEIALRANLFQHLDQ